MVRFTGKYVSLYVKRKKKNESKSTIVKGKGFLFITLSSFFTRNLLP